MRTLLRFPLLLLVAAAPALADEGQTYDLKKIVHDKVTAGESCRESETEKSVQKIVVTAEGNVVDQKDEKKGATFSRTVKIVEASPEGKPTKILFGYESFQDEESGEKPDVNGLEVTCTKAGDEWKLEAAGGKAIPPVVEAHIRAGLGKQDKEGNEEVGKALLPDKPVAVGASWDLDPDYLAKQMHMGGSTIVKDKSAAKGTLKAVTQKDGKDWFKVEISIKLVLADVQGQPMKEPMVMDMKMTMEAPAGGVYSELQMTMKATGVMEPQPGAVVTLDIDMSRKQSRTPLGS
ncbi:MAG: hypothetical protein AB7N76_16745 [Planctomycetota bacterium]